MLNKFELNKDFVEELLILIEKKDEKLIVNKLKEIHAADIADIIEILENEKANFLFDIIDNPKSADIIIELDDDSRESILKSLSPKKIANKFIKNLESDNAADVISELSDDKKEEVLYHLNNKEKVSDINELLNYNENSAGSLMAIELIKVNKNWSTVECVREMRKQASNIKNIHTIYVTDDNNKLCGLLSLKKLLVTEKSTIIKSIINTNFIAVKTDDDNEYVANLMNKYNLVVVPVVDNNNILVGRITIDDILSYVKEEAEKDFQIASGISEDIELNDSLLNITRARLPWLIIGLIGGLFGAKVIGVFDLKSNYELAFFIPLIAAMAGNVGVQSAAIIVQSIANNSIKSDDTFSRLFKEFRVGILNGLICSIIIFGLTFVFGYGHNICITVSISLFSVILFAALFGTLTPLILNKYKIDPALATGPFITTFNDIIGLIIYFSIGQTLLS